MPQGCLRRRSRRGRDRPAPMKLNLLCQSPVSEGMSPAQAIRNTVSLAQRADELGYHRFWFAEHHSDPALASASPEVMVASELPFTAQPDRTAATSIADAAFRTFATYGKQTSLVPQHAMM